VTDRALIKAIREEFQKRLQARTGWGRNDVMHEFDQACMDVILSEPLPSTSPKGTDSK